jgi:hypothetical protein
MLKVKLVWWIPIGICIIVGIVALIPLDTSEGASGTFLPYEPLIPLAPISSILIWLLGGLFYLLGRWATERPLRSPS